MLTKIIEAIDMKIANLQEAKKLISGIPESVSPPVKRRGRPVGSVTRKAEPVTKRAKRTMSVEARAKIAAAQKKRWAAAKKAA